MVFDSIMSFCSYAQKFYTELVSMVKQSPKPSNDLLEDLIDKRLARIFGEDAEILVIYPLKKSSTSSDLEEKSPSDKDSKND